MNRREMLKKGGLLASFGGVMAACLGKVDAKAVEKPKKPILWEDLKPSDRKYYRAYGAKVALEDIHQLTGHAKLWKRDGLWLCQTGEALFGHEADYPDEAISAALDSILECEHVWDHHEQCVRCGMLWVKYGTIYGKRPADAKLGCGRHSHLFNFTTMVCLHCGMTREEAYNSGDEHLHCEMYAAPDGATVKHDPYSTHNHDGANSWYMSFASSTAVNNWDAANLAIVCGRT